MTEPRIAYLFADPLVEHNSLRAVPQLNFHGEKDRIRSTLEECGHAVHWYESVATMELFRKCVLRGPRVLHYSGHGQPSYISLEDDNGRSHPFPSHLLRELFDAARNARPGGEQLPRCVVVSACHSEEVGRAFIAAGVPHVIAVRADAEILDAATHTFAQAFYESLLNGSPVAEAFRLAEVSVRCQPSLMRKGWSDSEPGKFILLPDDTEHSEIVFPALPKGPFVDESQDTRIHAQVPLWASKLFGRDPTVYEVYTALTSGAFRCCQLINLTGPKGIGKASIAFRTAGYVAERHQQNRFRRVDTVDLRRLGTMTTLDDQESNQSSSPNRSDTKFWESTYISFDQQVATILNECLRVLDLENQSREKWASVLRSMGKVLLVIIVPDHLQRAAAETLRRILHESNQLFTLVTSTSPLQQILSASCSVIRVPPLDDIDSAKLFAMSIPVRGTGLKPDDFGLNPANMKSAEDFYRQLAKTDILRAANGIPGVICKTAHQMNYLHFVEDGVELIEYAKRLHAKYCTFSESNSPSDIRHRFDRHSSSSRAPCHPPSLGESKSQLVDSNPIHSSLRKPSLGRSHSAAAEYPGYSPLTSASKTWQNLLSFSEGPGVPNTCTVTVANTINVLQELASEQLAELWERRPIVDADMYILVEPLRDGRNKRPINAHEQLHVSKSAWTSLIQSRILPWLEMISNGLGDLWLRRVGQSSDTVNSASSNYQQISMYSDDTITPKPNGVPYVHGFLTPTQAAQALSSAKSGTYLFRFSSTCPNAITASVLMYPNDSQSVPVSARTNRHLSSSPTLFNVRLTYVSQGSRPDPNAADPLHSKGRWQYEMRSRSSATEMVTINSITELPSSRSDIFCHILGEN